jgi:hypothetical protein
MLPLVNIDKTFCYHHVLPTIPVEKLNDYFSLKIHYFRANPIFFSPLLSSY